MKTLFDDADRSSLLQRLGTLQADTPRQWGKMNAAQMVTHCARALETGTGDRPMKQKLIGKIRIAGSVARAPVSTMRAWSRRGSRRRSSS